MINNINLMILKQRAKEYAEDIGLPIFGVASPEPLFHLRELLEKRKQKGLESPFEKRWQTEVRCRPDFVLSSVKSIICVGLPYYPSSDEVFPPLWGLSRHAWGRDYHLVLKEKLELLGDFLRSLTGAGFEYKTAVDSVPLVERALAHRAGLGWYGKNNLLINPYYGSWFVLGELLTNLELEPDAPMEKSCGNCEICLKACPTGALSAPYELDARKCVSCLTQSKADVPVGLREKVGRSLYGCDICQEVCPVNRSLMTSGGGCSNNVEGEDSSEDFSWEELIKLLSLTQEEFRKKYGETAFAWVGKERLQRNLVLALGCNGSDQHIPVLMEALESSSPSIRSHAEWSLEHICRDKKT